MTVTVYSSRQATLARRHVFAPGLDEPVVTDAAGVRTWHVADERGSVVAATPGSSPGQACSGMVVTSWGYGPHGEPDSRGLLSRFGFTGAVTLPQLGLTSMRARVYSHRLGRFLQPDPIGQAGGVNLYDYAGGDPVNRWDPWGLEQERIIITAWQDTVKLVGTSATSLMVLAGGGPLSLDQRADGSGTESQDNQCFGPPAAPGTGSTQRELAAQARSNAAEAASRYWNPLNLFWFRSQVKNNAPWDYKQYNPGYEDFGNYNYGRAGAAMGLATDFLLGQAGRAQQAAGTSKPEWGKPGFLGYGGLGGTGTYGDDPRDQEMIRRGISDERNDC